MNALTSAPPPPQALQGRFPQQPEPRWDQRAQNDASGYHGDPLPQPEARQMIVPREEASLHSTGAGGVQGLGGTGLALLTSDAIQKKFQTNLESN
jgi:hypothetical protein